MFPEIEQRRELAGIDQAELCKRAGVHPTTYSARKSGRRTMHENTLRRLDDALNSLIREKRDQIVEASKDQEDHHAAE